MATPYQATLRRGKKRKYRARHARRRKQQRLRAPAAFKLAATQRRPARPCLPASPAISPALPSRRPDLSLTRWVLWWLLLIVTSLHELPIKRQAQPTTQEFAHTESEAVIAHAAAPTPSLAAEAESKPRLSIKIPHTVLRLKKTAPAALPASEFSFSPPVHRINEKILPLPEMLGTPARIRWERLALVQAATLGMGGYGFVKYNGLFGKVGQPFKIGNDLTKDHTLLFDEVMHFQGSYRITQAVAGVYQWAGVPKSVADWIGAGTSAFIMTALEYVDGRRLKDEASYSDLVANFAGIGFALTKTRVSFLQDFDLRFSYVTPADPFRHDTVKRYERMTHWLTYDLNRKFGLPLHLGLGYGVRHPFQPKVKPQYFIGIGLSPLAILSHLSAPAAKPLEFLRFYHFGNRMQI